ncbi:MAG: cytochrome c3 family protein [Coriobacteriia bacterium]
MPKAAGKKRLLMWGAVAVVAVVAVVGGLVWHQQPSFCGALCHTPMASYVQGYQSGDAELLVATHEAAGKECLDCHEATLGQQMTEVAHWITGNFTFDSVSGKLVSRGDDFATERNCLTSGCHDMTREELSEKTSDLAFNPHDNTEPHSDVACATCHSMHGQSVMYCTRCHSEALAVTPEGWLTASQAAEK